MWWFVLVFLVLLKIPMIYLGYVIWWAIKDPPQPGEGYEASGESFGSGGPDSGRPWWTRPLPHRAPRRGPHGSPARRQRPAPVRAGSKQVT